jgi:hypothetical protein
LWTIFPDKLNVFLARKKSNIFFTFMPIQQFMFFHVKPEKKGIIAPCTHLLSVQNFRPVYSHGCRQLANYTRIKTLTLAQAAVEFDKY